MKKQKDTTKIFVMVLLGLLVLYGQVIAGWTVPVPVTEVNTEYAEWTPFLSFDGLSLYFARGRTSGYYHFRIFEATRQQHYGPFTSVNEVLSTSGKHLFSPWVSPNNLRMYYFAQTEHPILWQIKVSERASVNDPWPQGTDISELNTLGRVTDPRLTSDELIIVFRSDTIPGGQGGYDLWMASRPDRASPFDNVRNLAEINTAAHDVCPYVSPDGLTLVFQSGTHGDWQFFRSTRQSLSEPFGNIEQMPILQVQGYTNNHPDLSSDGSELYFIRLLGNDYSTGDIWVSFLEGNRIHFVDSDAKGLNDGSSWANAFNYLQVALAVAEDGDEILVAKGIYKPTDYFPLPPPPPPRPPGPPGSLGPPPPPTQPSRTITFKLKNGVVIKGGYAGFGEPDPNVRDIKLYETILSGDIGFVGDNSDNSFHVVTGNETDETAVLDGFTITGGNANGSSYNNKRGGGMHCDSDSTITNCTFINNSADWGGGGMYCGPTWCCVTEPTITNCTFIGNSAGVEGGGMVVGDSDPKLINCKISNNSAGSKGGGVMFVNDNFSSLVNCLINGNSADWGGGIYGVFCFQWTMTNCTVSGNSATERGGGMYNQYDCHMTLTNCIFWGNRDSGGEDESAQIDYEPGEAPAVNYSCIQGWTGNLGGTGNIDNDPCFVEMEYFDPIAYWKFDEADGTTAHDSVGNNHGTIYGAQWTSGQVGSALDFDGWDDYVDMADMVKNYLQTNYTISVWIKTNTISANYAFSIIAYRHSTDINPVLFALGQDHADIHFAVRDNYHNLAQPVYTNALTTNTWYHIAGVREENVLNVYVNSVSGNPDSAAFGEISPDNLKIGTIMFGGNPHTNYFNGTIDDVIIFDRALSAEEIQQLYQNSMSGLSDYHLLPDSPCIDAGDPNYPFDPNETDLDGKPRIIGGRIDMGAYEFEFQNTPPVADAGPDQVIECACNKAEGTKVTLDGSSSYDSDGDPITYTWTGPFVGSPAHGATPTITLEGGCPDDYVITLVVNDGMEDSEPDEVIITVVDTTPPDFELSVSPTMLWPPNHKMHEITPSWTVSDECDATPDVSLVGIVMNEGDNTIGDGHTTDDIQIGEDGSIYLRAERSGTGSNRVYTITYQAVDDSGNATVRSATVSIPHDFKALTRIKSR